MSFRPCGVVQQQRFTHSWIPGLEAGTSAVRARLGIKNLKLPLGCAGD